MPATASPRRPTNVPLTVAPNLNQASLDLSRTDDPHFGENADPRTVDRYYKTQYMQQVKKKMDALVRFVEERMRNRGARKLPPNTAIVWDVDDTLLCQYDPIVTEWNAKFISPAERHQGYMPALGPALTAWQTLHEKYGLVPLILTGRYERDRDFTEKNLHLVGYKNWRELAMRRPPHETNMYAERYKSERRQAWANQGYYILATVGDQYSDLTGPANGEVQVKLPNPVQVIR